MRGKRIRPRLEVLEDRTLLSGGLPYPTPSTVSQLTADFVYANSNAGSYTITLASNTTFNFTTADNTTNGANALPVLTGNVTIAGNGDTLNGSNAVRLFDVASGGSLSLENLVLTGGLAHGTGAAAEGGAIYSSGTLTLSGVTLKSNRAQGSNGYSGTPDSNAGKGASAYGGGLYVAGGAVTLSNDTLSNNYAQGGNGGNGFAGGRGASAYGGGVYVAGGTVTLSNDTLSNNYAQGGNGGNGLFSGPGVSAYGGGVYVAGGTVTLNNDTFSGNHAQGGNGGNGVAGSNGSNGTRYFHTNYYYSSSGALYNTSHYASGRSGNRGGNGGLGGNGGSGSGGGLYVAGGTVTLNNDTLSSNQANGGSGGSGGPAGAGIARSVYINRYIYPSHSNGSTKTTTTFGLDGSPGGNGTASGGGIYVGSGSVTLHDTLTSSNSGGDVSGSLDSVSDYNLIGDGSGGLSTTNHNLLGSSASPINPLLVPLGNYGGPTQTMALLPGSPAIDAGSSAYGGSTDQRGEPRLGATDIGAFESQGFTLAVSSGNNQGAPLNTAFADPVVVSITANNAVEPVAGGSITFTAPSSGASAILNGSPATIGSNGQASVTATANAITGAYTVAASASGSVSPASFSLSNAGNVVVTTLSDENNSNDGTTSLREAISYAETQTIPYLITFDPSILTKASGNIIDLLSALPDLTGYIIIEGPGANVLAVQRDASSAAFSVFTVGAGATAAISGLTISGGSAVDGGGIANDGTLSVNDSTLSGNTAAIDGGGIANNGSLTVSDSTLSGNTASDGGAIANDGTLSVNDSTLSGNTAANDGGGIANNGSLTVSDATLSDNTAGDGGGIFNDSSDPATLSNATLADNSVSTAGGGIDVASGSVLLHNTLIASNRIGDNPSDIAGNLNSTSEYNLIGDGSGDLSTTNHNLLGSPPNLLDPLLAPLSNYGGPTQSMALLPGSPAIDAGSSVFGGSTDQRGEPRVGATDIGAFESQGFTIAISSGNNQKTAPNTAFAQPLAVTVTASNFVEPVAGGLVNFTAPASGASAVLSSGPATIGSDGEASVKATANGVPGTYTVSASVTSVTGSASFSLKNVVTVPYVVTSTADDGSTGTLRDAINQVNAGIYIGIIDFHIAGTGVQTINLTSQLPALTIDGVFINGLSQGGSGNTTQLITLDGTKAGSYSDGLLLQGSNDIVSGLIIEHFGNNGFQNGIEVDGANDTIGGTTTGAGNVISGISGNGVNINGSGVLVQGNYIGTDVTGTSAVANAGFGVAVGGSNNTIGGTVAGARNIISGNGREVGFDAGGVVIRGSGVLVQGNYIGTDLTGTKALGNSGNGVVVGGANNTIGGTATGAGNLISGSTSPYGSYGVAINGSGVLVQGNYIGTDVTATNALANTYGIGFGGTYINGIDVGASDDTIGGTTAGAGNIISGNTRDGILINSNNSGMQVQGNYIGTNAVGSASLANSIGIEVEGGSDTIGGTTGGARNVISGNSADGVLLDSTANGVSVQGNYIGTGVTGTSALANSIGVYVNGTNITIGGTTAGARNLISGNSSDGLYLQSGAYGVSVQANYIGTDVTGTKALSKTSTGVYVDASNNTIGGTATAARNVISGNGNDGVLIASSASAVQVQGNYIGITAAGTAALSNNIGIDDEGSNNTLGGSVKGAGNVISGNSNDGIKLEPTAQVETAQGNYVGLDVSGKAVLANGRSGVEVAGTNNTIGGNSGSNYYTRNFISGNAIDGVAFDGAATGNVVLGNFIGLDISGTKAAGNVVYGIQISGSSNTVGGTKVGLGNVISGNGHDGILLGSTASSNAIQGNDIGTDYTGKIAMANSAQGVEILGAGNTLGGTASGARNIISGNAEDGVLLDSSASGTLIQGNYVGINFSSVALPNASNGIEIASIQNTVGGTSAAARNILSGNKADGLKLDSSASGNVVLGNFIGVNLFSSAAGNSNGIEVAGTQNTIGGSASGAFNVISGNKNDGVLLDSSASGDVVLGNSVGVNVYGNVAVGNNVGIEVAGAHNAVGASYAVAPNVISGNSKDGVRIDSGASGNQVLGNYLGTNHAGTVALANQVGIEDAGSGNTIGGSVLGARNVLSGNSGDGVLLDSTAAGEIFQGNYVGLNYSGKTALANGGNGVEVQGSNNLIGGNSGSNYFTRNFISGNTGDGLLIANGATGNVVQGNFIGIDVSGTNGVGNSIGIEVAGTSNTLGGASFGLGNVISGNSSDGLRLDNSATNNLVQRNDVGTNYNGTSAVSNGGNGVTIVGNNNTLGGSVAAAGNIIAYNSGDGVLVSVGVGNTITSNSIFANAAIGIALSNGGNNTLAAPSLLSASYSGGVLIVSGTYTAPTANVSYVIQIFASPSSNEGEVYLGSLTVTPTNSGSQSFSFSTATSTVLSNPLITATLTDSGDGTSEFALGIPA